MVPLSASSNLPGFSLVAPVNAPRSWPKSSDSSSSLGSAAQLIFTNGLPRRGERSCTVRAMPSLPTPLSPRMSTGTSVSATRSTMSQIDSIAGLEATYSVGTPRRAASLRSEAHRLHHSLFLVHRGERDHGRGTALSAILPQHLEAVEDRHPQVEEHGL